MCGIAGFTGSKNEDLLHRMTEAISYRGPDAQGFFSNGQINFGHRRLSIIDLSTGDQPMFDEKNQIALIYNGEIYNYKELKEEYLKKYNFKTKSDSEVIINLYLEKGDLFFNFLNGMFSLALWDSRSNKLILGRDRMGQKPLYYKEENGQVYFGSEPKTLILNNKPEVNYESLSLFFKFQYFPKDKTIYKNIFKLLPGEYLIWKDGKKEIKKYWSLAFNNSEKFNETKLLNLLKDSVKKRLVSDVPLGVFLSGGIDSTAIAHFASRASNQKIKTFSIGFEDSSFDESEFSNKAAKFVGSDHHHKVFSEKELLDTIPRVFELLDEPTADASILPTYLLSKFAKQYVTVALGGDGADELFGGYPTFQAHQLADSFLGKAIGNVSGLINKLPVSHKNFSLDFKLKQFVRGVNQKGYKRDIDWMSQFNEEEQHKLFNQEIVADGQINLDSIQDEKNKILAFWQQGYLVDNILTKVDRASMYTSLEARSPFMDYHLVEYVNNLSSGDKLAGMKTKALLKQVLANELPSEIINRKKKGFGIPISKWLSSELKDYMIDTLSKESIQKTNILNYNYVSVLISEHINKKKDHRLKLWSLISFMNWHKRFI